MWELDHKESWVLKNWCFCTVVLQKTLESPLDCKEIQPVHPKGNQSWIFIGRTDAEAPILWPPDSKNWLIGKDPDAGKDWRWEVKGMTEDEMVGWHHQLDGREFEQVPGVGDGQGGLAYCSPWGHKELDTTEQLNWTESQTSLCLSPNPLLLGNHHLFSVSVNLFLFCRGVHLYPFFFFYIPHIMGNMILVFVWLAALSVITSRSIHGAAMA